MAGCCQNLVDREICNSDVLSLTVQVHPDTVNWRSTPGSTWSHQQWQASGGWAVSHYSVFGGGHYIIRDLNTGQRREKANK